MGSVTDYIPKPVLPYEDSIINKIRTALISAYPHFADQIAQAPKEALMGMMDRLQNNPAGYMSESFLGGIGSGGMGRMMKGINSGIDALDETSGVVGDYIKGRSGMRNNSANDLLGQFVKART